MTVKGDAGEADDNITGGPVWKGARTCVGEQTGDGQGVVFFGRYFWTAMLRLMAQGRKQGGPNGSNEFLGRTESRKVIHLCCRPPVFDNVVGHIPKQKKCATHRLRQ